MNRRIRSRRGFTLLEIMLVVVIIGVIASIAIPTFKKLRETSQNKRFMNDLRLVSNAFQIYALENGEHPADVSRGQTPAGMANYLPKGFNFSDKCAIDGTWDWENGAFGVTAGLSVKTPNRDDAQMKEIDADIDDGNLSTGQFIKTESDRYTWVIEE